MLTTTSTLLLDGLTDPRNHAAWLEFDARYRPLLVRFAGRLGLDDTDAEEVAQGTLVRFAGEYRAGKYHRERGRLRSWIFAIARCGIADLKARRGRDRARRGESALAELPAEPELSRRWEAEWRGEVLRRALDELRASRTDARMLAVLDALLGRKTVAEIACELELSANAVSIAKHRALEQLRAIVTRLEQDF